MKIEAKNANDFDLETQLIQKLLSYYFSDMENCRFESNFDKLENKIFLCFFYISLSERQNKIYISVRNFVFNSQLNVNGIKYRFAPVSYP